MKKNQVNSNVELEMAFEKINSSVGEDLELLVDTINKLGRKEVVKKQNMGKFAVSENEKLLVSHQ